MSTKTRMPDRHARMLDRMVQLADAARQYAGTNDDQGCRTRRLRDLAQAALMYAASVRTMSRKP